jgi:hypothetical protein
MTFPWYDGWTFVAGAAACVILIAIIIYAELHPKYQPKHMKGKK